MGHRKVSLGSVPVPAGAVSWRMPSSRLSVVNNGRVPIVAGSRDAVNNLTHAVATIWAEVLTLFSWTDGVDTAGAADACPGIHVRVVGAVEAAAAAVRADDVVESTRGVAAEIDNEHLRCPVRRQR